MTTRKQNAGQKRGKVQDRNPGPMADELIQVVKEDHTRLRNLFSEFRNARGASNTSMSSQAGELAKMIQYMVSLHEAAEEDTIYITLQDQLADAMLIKRMLGEQQQTRQDIESLMDKQPNFEGYEQKLMSIISETEQHMVDEETQLFPVLEKLSLSDSREIAGEYIEYRRELENLRI